jgi:hypothetical protein
VRDRRESVALADVLLEGLDAWLDELDHPSARRADEVVVVLALAHPLVPVLLLVQPHAADEPAREEELERPVDGRAADLLPLGAHPDDEVVGIEMPMRREDLVEERRPFPRRLEALPP